MENNYKYPDQPYPNTVINAVLEERRFQDAKYGRVGTAANPGPGGHDLTGWLIVLQKELNEAFEAATGHGKRNRTGRNSLRSELVQIAAVAFAALEQHEVREQAVHPDPEFKHPADKLMTATEVEQRNKEYFEKLAAVRRTAISHPQCRSFARCTQWCGRDECLNQLDPEAEAGIRAYLNGGSSRE